MLSVLIEYSIAVACLLFVVSLPIAKLPIAKTMRRIAGALLLLAFLPSLFFGLITPAQGSGAAPNSAANPLAMIGGFVVLSVVAYVILAIRKRLKKSPKDAWSEFVGLRSSGKRPVGTDPRTSHTSSLFDVDP
jgi:hypothetical protein